MTERLEDVSLNIIHGDAIVDRGSLFQAHFAEVSSTNQIAKVVDHIEKDPKYASVTNVVWASKLYDSEKDTIIYDSDDGDEYLAGIRLQLLLEKIKVNNIVVIATCWQGEEYLYLDIYKHINERVLSLLMVHGLLESKTPEEIAVSLERFEVYFEKRKHKMAYKAYCEAMKQAEQETRSSEFDFIHSEVIADRKSKFQAHLAKVTSQEQVEQALAQLKMDSKIAKATYNMLAYRIYVKERKSFLEEGRDDGENAAGRRLLHLLQISDVVDTVVIVTRWHGGVHIGPDRFKHINACANDVIKISTEQDGETFAAAQSTAPPNEISLRGPLALEAFEKALLNGKTKNQRLFLMLVGPSRVGKTSLLKSLRGEAFDPNEDSTHGVELHRCCCELVDGVWEQGRASKDAISFEHIVSKNIVKQVKSEQKINAHVERNKLSSPARSSPINNTGSKRKNNSMKEKHTSGRPVDDENAYQYKIMKRVKKLLKNPESTEGENIICTALDIAGQPVYDVIHPLFISRKGVFVLVYNLENDARGLASPAVKNGTAIRIVPEKCSMTNMDHLEFWLSSIELSAAQQSNDKPRKHSLMPEKQPPAFLVFTHADKAFDGQDATEMSRKILKHLKSTRNPPGKHVVLQLYPVDNTVSGSSEDESVRKLRKDIREVAKCLPHMNEDVPVRWFRFEKELLSLVQVGKNRYLSIDETKKIALDCKVDVESDEFLTLLNYLHDIREIIFFEGTETVFIDIPWLVSMISKVITVEPFENWQEEQTDSWTKLENEGVLDVSLLEHVWREVADDKHAIDSLLVIMEKFSLVCRWKIDDKEDVFLVPAMLMNSSAKDIAELLKDQMPPLIVYFPSSHLPLGIFPRLQVLFAELCNRKWSSARPPKFFHNFCRFFSIGKDESFDLVLTSDIRTISIGVINYNGADDQKISEFCQEIIEFLKTKLGTDMRKDFPWMERMKYNLCIRCPICKPSPDCNLPHVPGCVSPTCVHFITEQEILKVKRLRCLENPTSKVTEIPCDYFSHWFPKPEKVSASRPIHGAGPETLPIGITSTTGSLSLDENKKRWVVVGIAIMKVLLPALRTFVLPNITKHYNNLKASHNIHTQVFGTHLKMDGTSKFNYDSINSNQGKKPPLFDYMVTSEVDLAKLYLKPFMAKFTGIDESCDLSAVLGILSSASVFTTATQDAAKDVRQHVRNEWGHCNFTVWDEAKIAYCFKLMDVLVKSLILADEEEKKLLEQLKEWEKRGVVLLLGNPADGGLLKLQEDVILVLKEVQSLKEGNPEEFQRINFALQAFKEEVVKCLKKLEEGQEDLKEGQKDLKEGQKDLKEAVVAAVESGVKKILEQSLVKSKR